jgi:hypothetical protein
VHLCRFTKKQKLKRLKYVISDRKCKSREALRFAAFLLPVKTRHERTEPMFFHGGNIFLKVSLYTDLTKD